MFKSRTGSYCSIESSSDAAGAASISTSSSGNSNTERTTLGAYKRTGTQSSSGSTGALHKETCTAPNVNRKASALKGRSKAGKGSPVQGGRTGITFASSDDVYRDTSDTTPTPPPASTTGNNILAWGASLMESVASTMSNLPSSPAYRKNNLASPQPPTTNTIPPSPITSTTNSSLQDPDLSPTFLNPTQSQLKKGFNRPRAKSADAGNRKHNAGTSVIGSRKASASVSTVNSGLLPPVDSRACGVDSSSPEPADSVDNDSASIAGVVGLLEEKEFGSKNSSPTRNTSPNLSCADLGLPDAGDKRWKEFKKIFPEVIEGEMLHEDFHCAFQRPPGILMAQGRLYVSSHNLYFFSTVFGTFKMAIPFSNITSIQKHKLVGVIPNAILVVEGQNKHIFHNFLSRDSAFDLLCKLWSVKNPNSAVAVFSDDCDFNSSTTPLSSAFPLPASDNRSEAEAPSELFRGPTTCPCTPVHDQWMPLIDEVFAMEMGKLWALLFVEGGFRRRFLEGNRKCIDVVLEEWCGGESINGKIGVGSARNLEYTIPLGVACPRTKVVEKLEAITDDYICVQSLSTTPEVYCGDYFQTALRLCLSHGDSPATSRLRVSFQVDFVKPMNKLTQKAVVYAMTPKIVEFHKALSLAIRAVEPAPIGVERRVEEKVGEEKIIPGSLRGVVGVGEKKIEALGSGERDPALLSVRKSTGEVVVSSFVRGFQVAVESLVEVEVKTLMLAAIVLLLAMIVGAVSHLAMEVKALRVALAAK
ncbi:hypothetical protein HDU67_005362 [Dinochytrium kinnereticum]|nr:hypothetical protein HDU67_005362 [Dinochytrium kinnereticum]